jgi:hypothetical protein
MGNPGVVHFPTPSCGDALRGPSPVTPQSGKLTEQRSEHSEFVAWRAEVVVSTIVIDCVAVCCPSLLQKGNRPPLEKSHQRLPHHSHRRILEC